MYVCVCVCECVWAVAAKLKQNRLHTNVHSYILTCVCVCACSMQALRESTQSWDRERELWSTGHHPYMHKWNQWQGITFASFTIYNCENRWKRSMNFAIMNSNTHTHTEYKSYGTTRRTCGTQMMFDRVASRSKTRSKLNELRFHSLEFLLGFCAAAGRGSSLTVREKENKQQRLKRTQKS